MEIFFTSAVLVAIAEIGDKTMLLAILLATRFKQPLPIIAGIFVATIANHALAAWAGSALAGFFASDAFRYAIAFGFILMAGWTLIPDKVDDDMKVASQRGAFLRRPSPFSSSKWATRRKLRRSRLARNIIRSWPLRLARLWA